LEHITISHERLKYGILREIFYEIFLLQSSRFGEALRSVQEDLDAKNFYAFNASFDAPVSCPPGNKQ
jgi:hypothetical protein